mmetsp:Transcript_16385/g.35826  ORF Transcript_16385/g.35826 Transcript_16385/m.35826 type:complete len:202 (-) Transcript_16385:157-762(-)
MVSSLSTESKGFLLLLLSSGFAASAVAATAAAAAAREVRGAAAMGALVVVVLMAALVVVVALTAMLGAGNPFADKAPGAGEVAVVVAAWSSLSEVVLPSATMLGAGKPLADRAPGWVRASSVALREVLSLLAAEEAACLPTWPPVSMARSLELAARPAAEARAETVMATALSTVGAEAAACKEEEDAAIRREAGLSSVQNR